MNLLFVPESSSAGSASGWGTGTVLLVPSSPKSLPRRLGPEPAADLGFCAPCGSSAFGESGVRVMVHTHSGNEMAAFLARQRQAVGCWRPHHTAAASFDGERPAAGQPANAGPFAAHRKISNRDQGTGIAKAGTIFWHGDFLHNSQQKFTLGLPLPALYRNQRKCL